MQHKGDGGKGGKSSEWMMIRRKFLLKSERNLFRTFFLTRFFFSDLPLHEIKNILPRYEDS